jgi:hypothetical protein
LVEEESRHQEKGITLSFHKDSWWYVNRTHVEYDCS